MYIKGKLQTEQKRTLDFEFKTIHLGKTLGNSGDWFDNTFSIKSELTVNGNPIGHKYYNFCLRDEFKDQMFKNSVITEINNIKFDDFDLNVIGNNLYDYIKDDPDLKNTFLSYYGYELLEPNVLADNYKYWIEEYICFTEDIHQLTNDVFELSNDYHGLSQWNSYLDGLFSVVSEDLEELSKEIA